MEEIILKCEKLDVWKRSCRLSVDIYKLFANSKDFGFKDQITRSALSIASNIAEGMEKVTGLKLIKECDEILKMCTGLRKNYAS